MLILFLNELSTDNKELDLPEARHRALRLIEVLRLVRKQQTQVALNSQASLKGTFVDTRYTIAELLAGDEYRDKLRFLRGFENRSPISAGMDTSFDLQLEEISYYYKGGDCIAMGWADQLNSGVVSLLDEAFIGGTIEVDKVELDDAAELIPSTVNIRNFSESAHIDEHFEWLQSASFKRLSEAGVLWKQREEVYPHLRFLSRTKSDMDNLRVSGACYLLVVQRLNELNQDIENWAELESDWPEFSSKVTPEAENRKRLCNVLDGEEEHNFHWHLRFTGGIAGRIHFRISAKEKKAVIAYLGNKLQSPIVR